METPLTHASASYYFHKFILIISTLGSYIVETAASNVQNDAPYEL